MSSPLTFTRSQPTRLLHHPMFSREVKALQRGHVDANATNLHKLSAQQMMDRREFVRRQTPVVMEVGAHTGWFFRLMMEKKSLWGLKQYIQTDISEERLNRNYEAVKHLIPPSVEFIQVCCEEEQEPQNNKTPFEIPDNTVDMVVSNLSMHWVNNLELAMVNIRRALKPDGFVMMSCYGGNTLYELRSSFAMAEKEAEGGLSPHVSPMLDGAGISNLMLQTGFNLPSIDMDRHIISYKSPFHLMEHLQDQGETAVHLTRRPNIPRSTFLATAAIYEGMYGHSNMVPATYEIFHSMAWSPSPDHPEPLAPGSQQLSFTQLSKEDHKEFQQVLQELARDPEDSILMRRAEDLFRQMRSDVEKEQQDRTMGEVPNLPEHEPSAPAPKPTPPNFNPEADATTSKKKPE